MELSDPIADIYKIFLLPSPYTSLYESQREFEVFQACSFSRESETLEG